MYNAFVESLPLFVSLWQSGFYNLFSAAGLKPYQDAWLDTKLPDNKEN